jgi:hypothetical protein
MLNNRARGQALPKSLTSILFFLCLILVACGGVDSPEPGATLPQSPQPQPTEANLGESFSLTVGQSATIEGTGLTLTFEMVERDGRCPSAVICKSNGPVVVIISAVGDDLPLTTFTMNPDPALAALDGISPNIFSLEGYEIELTAVTPYPEQPEDIMNLVYTAALIVTESNLEEGNVIETTMDNPFVLEIGQTAAI